MDINKEKIVKRFNEAIYDLFLATKALNKEDKASFLYHIKNAGEAISQTTELALKFHLYNRISARERQYFHQNQNILSLTERYKLSDGTDGDYFHETIDDIDPSVDFLFLSNNKGKITNQSKHGGKDPDFEIQKKYIEQTRLFINEYIDAEVKLKTIQDYDKNNTDTWDLLYAACDRFSSEERTLILIIGPNQNVDPYHLRNLSLPKWNLIIDFDYYSEKNGFYNSAYSENPAPPHIFKVLDLIDNNALSPYSQTHYHYFANNFPGSGESETKDFNEWNKKYSKKVDIFIKSFSEVFSNQKNIVLVLHNSRRHINFLCERIEYYFGENCTFVFANDTKAELGHTPEDFNGIKVNISIPEISDGIAEFSSNFGIKNINTGTYIIPYNEKTETKTSGELSPSEFAQLEEYFEVLHKGLPIEIEGEEERRAFLCGNTKISWFGLRNRFDAERQSFNKKYIKPIEKVLENTRGKINLIHEAGFGGTTVARRIAWHFHDDYPTLILKKFSENKIREHIVNLHQKTRITIFVILEVPQTITIDEVDALYKSITRPVVFLVVKRGKNVLDTDLAVTDWGNDTIDLIKAYRPYLKEYSNDVIKVKKEKEYAEIIDSNDTYKKTPFYIGLLTFEERFHAIKDYIRKFTQEVIEKGEQKRVLLYLSICDDYLGQGLPSSFFKKIFKVQNSEILQLEKYFSTESGIIESLLNSTQVGSHKFWKIKHNFFSKELKYQLLSGSSENPEIWKQGLADACHNFILDSTSEGSILEYTQDILQKLFIGTTKDRAGTDFTLIINDIGTLDGKEKVFLALKEAYPENPHYCSHLARFYAYQNKNREKAIKYADEAIRLCEIEGKQDPILYHIKGMCLRSNIYDIMDKLMLSKRRNIALAEEQYDEIINILVPQCTRQFELSREISNQQNRKDEYGLIARIQLLIKAIDFAIILSGKSKTEFFIQNSEPFSEWLDTAESLLEEVKRININEDESGYIESCVNDILEFYNNYEQILQNLRSQLDKGKNPARTRRQIVRTYFRKKENYFTDNKTLTYILNLLEQNIENEPDIEKNFYLWFQAARHSKLSLVEVIEKLSKWKANSTAIDSIYYFYIIKVFRALEGHSESTIDAFNLISECKKKGKSNTTIHEWYGKGIDISKLVSRHDVSEDNKESKLELVDGYFTEYMHDGSGKITIADKLEVFFSPTQAKLTSNDINKPVQFYLGFSFDGLRADSNSVRIKGSPPRNTDSSMYFSKSNVKEVVAKPATEIDRREKIEPLIVKGKIELPEVKQKFSSKRKNGKVIDLQKSPYYTWGKIESEFGKKYFFHKDNEIAEIFDKIKIGIVVSFDFKKNEKGWVAYNIEII